MEVANTFAVAGELMDFALTRRREGHPIPTSLFRYIITEKCQLINNTCILSEIVYYSSKYYQQ